MTQLLNAVNDTAVFDILQQQDVLVAITGTVTGLGINWEGTIDGNNWVGVRAYSVTDGTWNITHGPLSTPLHAFLIPNFGFISIRVKCASISSGTAEVVYSAVIFGQRMVLTITV